jgi:hypothetical protein
MAPIGNDRIEKFFPTGSFLSGAIGINSMAISLGVDGVEDLHPQGAGIG